MADSGGSRWSISGEALEAVVGNGSKPGITDQKVIWKAHPKTALQTRPTSVHPLHPTKEVWANSGGWSEEFGEGAN
jgi:hypothetical protein